MYNHLIDCLILDASGTFEPPRQADNPRSQYGFRKPDRPQFAEHCIAVQVEVGLVFAVYYRLMARRPRLTAFPAKKPCEAKSMYLLLRPTHPTNDTKENQDYSVSTLRLL